MWCHGGDRVVTWGEAMFGGECSRVQNQLKNIQQIEGGCGVFAACLGNGDVVTWGAFNGDSSDSEFGYEGEWTDLRDPFTVPVQSISRSGHAFAALHHDGTVSTWGVSEEGGDSSEVQSQLTDVREIVGTLGAFAALKEDGSVVSWGSADYGGDSSNVQDKLKQVKKVYAARASAFAALLCDRTVVAWGDADDGGDISEVQDQLKNVVEIQSTAAAFAALLEDRKVVTWGAQHCGGDSSSVQHQLKNVKRLGACGQGFVAILHDDSAVMWGASPMRNPETYASIKDQLKDVQQICGHFGSRPFWLKCEGRGADPEERCPFL